MKAWKYFSVWSKHLSDCLRNHCTLFFFSVFLFEAPVFRVARCAGGTPSSIATESIIGVWRYVVTVQLRCITLDSEHCHKAALQQSRCTFKIKFFDMMHRCVQVRISVLLILDLMQLHFWNIWGSNLHNPELIYSIYVHREHTDHMIRFCRGEPARSAFAKWSWAQQLQTAMTSKCCYTVTQPRYYN